MNIVQFLRILWAHKLVILAATGCCLVGAVLVVLLVPARWEARSRVMLGLLKPDPVTGVVSPTTSARTYVSTQLELITDYSVAGQVVDDLGWLNDPSLVNAYNSRSKRDTRDFRRWAAQLVMDRTKVRNLQDSNILEITYAGSSAENARAVADSLRKAYIDQSLAFHRRDAEHNADWFEGEAQKAKAALDQAESVKADYERANGIVMQDDREDVDSARLRSLSMQAAVGSPVPQQTQVSQSAIELGQIDGQIVQLSKSLGPNHPELQALRLRRAALAVQAAREEASARSANSGVSASAAMDRAVQAAKARVIAQRDKLARLDQLQADVNLRKEQYNKAEARLVELRQQQAVDDTGLTPLGNAIAPKDPAFPNNALIFPGAIVLGGALGALVSLIGELIARKVRTYEELEAMAGIPFITAIAAEKQPLWKRLIKGERALPLRHAKGVV